MARTPDEHAAREARVILRVLPEEREAWRRTAKQAGLTFSAWLRALANKASGRATSTKRTPGRKP